MTKKSIKVYCGESVQDKCKQQLHPVVEVMNAKALVEAEHNVVTYSNSPDFIMAVKYIGKKQQVETEFFLNGVSTGNDIELVFEDLNRSFDMINEFGATED